MSIEIRLLDRADEAQVRRYWEVGGEAVAERPFNTHLAWQAARTYLVDGPVASFQENVCAWDGDELVGVASVSGSLVDNVDEAFVHATVLPSRRREGIGSLLLDRLVDLAGVRGRTLLSAEAFAPVDADSPALLFAEHHGFARDLEDGMKIADLQATKATWPALAAEAAPHHADYRIVTSWAPIPDELAEGWCAVTNRFYELAPSGDLQREAESWTVERLREREAKGATAGRADCVSVAIAPDGEVAAITELGLNVTVPHRSWQSGTVVLPEHRGHRLGLALKLANHTALLARFPDVEWIVTGNAAVNAPMNAINDQLGFRTVERCVELTRRL